ncbi:ferredoxin--NADP reductase [Litoribacter ruber]|uniref:Ferredoxin--NADP reductase n=1 Tax=Litoribacter ruber TaxID=702568 RepID=A0AAP2CFV8_9BACT|nr:MULTISPECIES: ferredoxin--NADP reductase [Litoribacter]MBS9523858.1 ferredoxin--NADP reductase [Litoribacter alkaliphilus]MBT0811548.1 ferredoxin--NADP reductase [Litoribacter ruber]
MFNLFRKKKEEKPKGSQYLSLKIREVVRETPDTVTLFFEQPEPYLDYKAGQFLTVILDIDGKEVRRSYSLCTSPFMDPHPGITIKRVKDGLVSNFLNDKMFPGKTITILKPMGNFTTDLHSKNRRHFTMIAAGSGITPVMGIIKSLLVNEPESKITLLYCSRSEDQIIFKKPLEDLQGKYPQLDVVHNLTQPSDSWKGLRGRIDAEKIKEVLSTRAYPEAESKKFYLCGPEALMATAKDTLLAIGERKEDIIQESFYTSASEDAGDPTAQGVGEVPELARTVLVMLEGQEYSFEVTPDKTILEAGLDEDLDMPYSCQSGLCTACMGKLVSGEVKMDEDAGLSESEKEEGYILCCVSRPMSGDVKIAIE